MKKTIYIFLGCVSIVLGVVGIFIPGLPTTPFLLLSSWLFYHSSTELHDALHRSKWLGPYLQRFQDRNGVGWKTKFVSIACMWTMITLSALLAFDGGFARCLLFGLGFIGTCCVVFIVPGNTVSRSPQDHK